MGKMIPGVDIRSVGIWSAQPVDVVYIYRWDGTSIPVMCSISGGVIQYLTLCKCVPRYAQGRTGRIPLYM